MTLFGKTMFEDGIRDFENEIILKSNDSDLIKQSKGENTWRRGSHEHGGEVRIIPP